MASQLAAKNPFSADEIYRLEKWRSSVPKLERVFWMNIVADAWLRYVPRGLLTTDGACDIACIFDDSLFARLLSDSMYVSNDRWTFELKWTQSHCARIASVYNLSDNKTTAFTFRSTDRSSTLQSNPQHVTVFIKISI